MKYRRIPTEIEAVQVKDLIRMVRADRPVWIDDAVKMGILGISYDGVVVRTINGPLHPPSTAWLVQAASGDIYPVTADMFDKLYEPVGPSQ